MNPKINMNSNLFIQFMIIIIHEYINFEMISKIDSIYF